MRLMEGRRIEPSKKDLWDWIDSDEFFRIIKVKSGRYEDSFSLKRGKKKDLAELVYNERRVPVDWEEVNIYGGTTYAHEDSDDQVTDFGVEMLGTFDSEGETKIVTIQSHYELTDGGNFDLVGASQSWNRQPWVNVYDSADNVEWT